jgi:hypothetical protein
VGDGLNKFAVPLPRTNSGNALTKNNNSSMCVHRLVAFPKEVYFLV